MSTLCSSPHKPEAQIALPYLSKGRVLLKDPCKTRINTNLVNPAKGPWITGCDVWISTLSWALRGRHLLNLTLQSIWAGFFWGGGRREVTWPARRRAAIRQAPGAVCYRTVMHCMPPASKRGAQPCYPVRR